jgi:cell division protein ZipA
MTSAFSLRIIGSMSANEFRILIGVIGLAVLAAIYYFGRPKRAAHGRQEPKLPWQNEPVSERFEAQNDLDAEALANTGPLQAPLDFHAAETQTAPTQPVDEPKPGQRVHSEFDLIISLHVMARDSGLISGGELIVAAEKASLIYGAQGLFHRLVDGRPEAGPIFSMINRLQPGRFELSKIAELQTPGVSFFMTLPCALSGLDAWDRMLPAAQRLAGLLNADVYDEEMNLLGRQRIASIRDELRAYDRKSELRLR